jgi:dTDP-4-amino-4,6-dideoxygalactose transaminase
MATRAIGSVLPLPDAGPAVAGSLWDRWTQDWGHVAAYRTARGALAALIAERGIRRLWLPAYACQALADAAVGIPIIWYGVDETLAPDLAALSSVRAGDAVLAIDYFGAPPPAALLALRAERRDALWIEDRAQAADSGAAWGDVLLYSPRKLLGVAEGGLMVSQAPLPAPGPETTPVEGGAQAARRDDPLGDHPERWFAAFQAQEAAFAVDTQPMAPITRALLQATPLEPLAQARRDNYAVLLGELADYALWPKRSADFAPLAFPVRVQDRDAVARAMAAERFYCARHWPDLPSDPHAFPATHRLNASLLSLPCDQRYDGDDMQRLADGLRTLARPV